MATTSIREHVVLSPDLCELSRARELIKRVGTRAGLPEQRVFDACVAVSEACANAMEHTGATQEVRVEAETQPDRVEVRVWGPGEFRLPPPGVEREHRGLGLPLMATLSDHLTLYSQPEGGTLVSLVFFLPGRGRSRRGVRPLPPAEVELRQENILLSTILASASLGIFVLDPDLCVRWANPAAESFLEESRSHVVGVPLDDILPALRETRSLEMLTRVSQTGRPLLREDFEVSGFDRGPRYWQVQVVPLGAQIEDPPFDLLVMASETTPEVRARRRIEQLVDETEQLARRADARAREAEEANAYVEAVLDALDDGFVLFDPEWRVAYANHKALELARKSGEEVLGQVVWQLQDGIDPRFRQALEQAARDRKATTLVARYGPFDVWIEMRAFPFAAGLATFLRDVTEQHFAAVERDRLYEEQRLSAELNAALAAVDRAIHSSLDPDLVSRRSVIEGTRALGADSSVLSLHEEGGFRVTHSYGWTEDLTGLFLPDERDPHGLLAMRSGETLAVDDARSDPRVDPDLMRAYGVQSVILAPLVVGKRSIGTISFNHLKAPHHFSAREVEFVTQLATSLSLALENAQLMAGQRRGQQLAEALSVVNSRLLGAHESEEVVREVIDLAREALDFPMVALLVRLRDDWHLGYLSGTGSERLAARLSDSAFVDGLVAAQSGRSLVTEGETPLLTAALEVRDQVFGVLVATGGSRAGGMRVDFFEKVAGSLSLALERRTLWLAQEEARRLAEAMNEVSELLTASPDTGGSLREVLATAGAALGVDSAGIALRLTDGRWVPAYTYGLPEDVLARTFSDEEFPAAAEVCRTRTPVYWDEERGDVDQMATVQLAGIKAGLSLPLLVRNEFLGVLAFHYHSSPARFTPAEDTFARTLASRISNALETEHLLATQRHIADTLQGGLLTIPEQVPGVSFSHVYRSATDEALIGGDFYDLIQINECSVAIVIGDVAGHGVDAARMGAATRDTIRAYGYLMDSPCDVLQMANATLGKNRALSGFVTVFLGLLDLATGDLIYCSAGHPPALIRRADASVEMLTAGAPPIGVFDQLRYHPQRAKLQENDLLLTYTDGLTEARAGSECFGEERLIELLRESRDVPLEDLPGFLLEAVGRFAGGRFDDDLALLAVRLAGAGRPGLLQLHLGEEV